MPKLNTIEYDDCFYISLILFYDEEFLPNNTRLFNVLRDCKSPKKNTLSITLAEVKLGKATADKILGAKLIEFEGSGHIPHLEIPDELIKSLK